MSAICLSAASYIDSARLGSRATGLRAWGKDKRPESGFAWADVSKSEFPRFDRMNGLCRLAVAAIELLGVDFAAWPEERRLGTGVAFGSALGSLETDLEFMSGLAAPSPTLFAYTLASAVVGEVCIRNRLQGPNTCLFCGPDDSRPVLETAMTWLEDGAASACLCIYADTPPREAGPYAMPAGVSFCAAACLLEPALPSAPRDCRRAMPLPCSIPAGVTSMSDWIRELSEITIARENAPAAFDCREPEP